MQGSQGRTVEGGKFLCPKWITPPESGQKKIHKKKTNSDEDDVERFDMFRSIDRSAFDSIK